MRIHPSIEGNQEPLPLGADAEGESKSAGGGAPPADEANGTTNVRTDAEGEYYAPRWVPYNPPLPGRWARLRRGIGRYGFAVACLLLAIGLVAFLQVLPSLLSEAGAPRPAGPPGEPLAGQSSEATPSIAAETAGGSYEGLAYLRVTSRPLGATVVLDLDTLGMTPLQSVAVPAGVHVLSLYSASGASVDTVIALKQGASHHLAFTLNPNSPGSIPQARIQDPNFQNRSPQLATRSPEPATRSPEPATRSPEPATRSLEPATRNRQPLRPGALRLTSEPSGAVVVIDGERAGMTPLTVSDAVAGTHRVTFRMEGYRPDSANLVTVRPGRQSLVHGRLERQGGTLRVLARPWASIYINGVLKARSTDLWQTMRLPAGSHRIKAVHPSLGTKTYVVQLAPGEEQSVILELTKNVP